MGSSPLQLPLLDVFVDGNLLQQPLFLIQQVDMIIGDLLLHVLVL